MSDAISTSKKKKRGRSHGVTDTSKRYLDMLGKIPRAPQMITVADIKKSLARDYDITTRTIQRDLLKLATEFKLECKSEGRSNYWSFQKTSPNWMFPRMDAHTAISFELAKPLLQPLLPPDSIKTIKQWFDLSAETLKDRDQPLARWSDKIHIRPHGLIRARPTTRDGISETVYWATLNETPLTMCYHKRDSEHNEHYQISPLGIVVSDQITYLVASKHPSRALRYFALHRIISIFPDKTIQFTSPSGFNLHHYADEEFGVRVGETQVLDLTLRMTNSFHKLVEESPISPRQWSVKDGEHYYKLTAPSMLNTYELRAWIRSMGKNAEVLEPGFLRQELANEFNLMAEKYRTNTGS